MSLSMVEFQSKFPKTVLILVQFSSIYATELLCASTLKAPIAMGTQEEVA
jgi:hypothetical protein